MKKKSLTAGMVVETVDNDLVSLTEEHSLVAQQYQDERTIVIMSNAYQKGKLTAKDTFTVSPNLPV